MNELLRALLDLPPQASSYAFQVDLLHYFVIAATMGGATFVFALALYYVVRYRRRPREAGETTLVVPAGVFTETFVIVSLLSLFLGFWVVGDVLYDHIMSPPAGAMQIYVTAKQWMWEFSYPGGRATMDVLTVPAARPVELVMTSRDVIHSFYVPAFRMKHDVVPGRYYVAWFQATAVGDYPIECAEYCGVNHSRMLGRVRVLSPADYQRWLDDRPDLADSRADLAIRGIDVAARRGCLNCHTLDGQPHIGPSWAGLYASSRHLLDGRDLIADDAYLTRSMMEPSADVVAGYKPVMPSYRGVLEQPEVAALVELIRSIRARPIAPSIVLPRVETQAQGRPQEPAR